MEDRRKRNPWKCTQEKNMPHIQRFSQPSKPGLACLHLLTLLWFGEMSIRKQQPPKIKIRTIFQITCLRIHSFTWLCMNSLTRTRIFLFFMWMFTDCQIGNFAKLMLESRLWRYIGVKKILQSQKFETILIHFLQFLRIRRFQTVNSIQMGRSMDFGRSTKNGNQIDTQWLNSQFRWEYQVFNLSFPKM